jgi:integrase/recombinase XerC
VIVHLILNTGLRVAELCAINCGDIGWKTGKINVIRKEDADGGGKSNYVCVSDTMLSMLNEYIEDSRPLLSPNEGNYDALFIGNKHSRISPRSVERMVSSYADSALGKNHGITPHKLRATFGSRYYKKTSDLTATAYALNHMSGVNVAARYYLRPADDALEQAAHLDLVPDEKDLI